jgi:hypothetical protein
MNMSNIKTVLEPAVVSCPRPLPSAVAHECEFTLNIGVFMDGTDNNKVTDPVPSANTNIVRLWQAYRNAPLEGSFSYYASGVGTPFTEIDELKAPSGGGPAGEGGEARIIYALLQVINSVHRFIDKDEARFSQKQLAALCTDTRVPTGESNLTAPQKILKDLGLSRGLVGNATVRKSFIRSEAMKLIQQVKASTTLPKVKSIYLDVFGFSRGAAQARVFTTWLHELMLSDGQLFGAKSYVRMLGLFDTVSSVGLTDAAGSHGHNGWAQERDLRIHKDVKNCVHYVALHELRTNFPSDSVGGAGGVIPANCSEHFCPGVHSDVGGSYAAGEQGKGVREEPLDPRVSLASGGGAKFVPDDTRKLSQLTLNKMFTAALKTCEWHESIPWIDPKSAAGRRTALHTRFAMPLNREGLSLVTQAVTEYFAQSKVPEGLTVVKALRKHGECYLAWRYQVDKEERFGELRSVERAKVTDTAGLKYYLQGEEILSRQLMVLSKSPTYGENADPDKSQNGFSRHAPEIYKAMTTLELGSGIGRFFDEWVHDSYAGFIGKFEDVGPSWAKLGGITHIAAEGQRYVRWRGVYCGGNDQLNASVPEGMSPGADQSRMA